MVFIVVLLVEVKRLVGVFWVIWVVSVELFLKFCVMVMFGCSFLNWVVS